MITTFKIAASELNQNFIDAIKHLFENTEIEILIRPAEKSEKRNFNYSKSLLKAVDDTKNNKN